MKKVHVIMNAVHGVFVALAIMCASALSAFANPTVTIEDGVLTAVELNGATEVVIPSGVTSIGEGAFYECGGLTSITMPNSVTNIGNNAFRLCYGLTNVTIPGSVTSIGDYAFADCWELSEVVFLGDMSMIDMDVASVFEGSWWFREYCRMGAEEIDGATGSVTRLVEANVEDEMYLWYDVAIKWYKWTAPKSGLMTVQVEDTDYKTALDGCYYDADGSWITDFGAEVEEVDGSEDRYTGRLEFDVEKGSTCYFAVVNFGERRELTLTWSCVDAVYEFEYEDNDDGTVTLTGVDVLEEYGDWELVIPSEIDGKTVVAIGSDAFGAFNMTAVSIPDSVTSIGDYAFSGCSGLTSVTIPNSVTSIGNYAFGWCEGLTSVTIQLGVASIGEGAFQYCDNLSEVVVPSSVATIGYYAFYGCYNLVDVYLPKTLDGAFYFYDVFEYTATLHYYSGAELTYCMVTLNVNGGNDLFETNFTVVVGSKVDALPVPTRDGYVFAGWSMVADGGESVTAIAANMTLYARWGLPVEFMDTEDISFSTDGGWYVEEGTGPSGVDSIASYANDEDWNDINGLCANVTGAGTFTFKCRPTVDEDWWWSCSMYVNGNYEEMYTAYSNGKWQDCSIIIRGEPDDVQSIEWYTRHGKTELSDFVWTPAPESMTITFETNGAGELDGVVCSSSDVVLYSDVLPTLSRDGYVFAGWYLDPGFTKPLDDTEIVGFYDVTLYARWELSVEVMNTDDIKFFAPEGSCWYAKESSDANGGYVATRFSSDKWVEDEYLKVKTVGHGYLSFDVSSPTYWIDIKYSINGGDVQECECFYFDSAGVVHDSLTLMVVADSSTATNEIAFSISNSEKVNDALYNFTWTPAPESMTVSFDSEGGSAVPANTYVQGDRFGELPVPVRDGYTFLGWFCDGDVLGGIAVSEDEFVPFGDMTLVAKWAANDFSALPDVFTDVDFWPLESSVRQIVSADGSSVVEFVFDFGDEMYYSMSEMTAKTTCAGYLSFEVGIGPAGLINLPAVTIDAKDVTVRTEMVKEGSAVEWTRYHVAIPDGQHDISWSFSAWNFGSSSQSFAGAWIRNIKFEPIASQDDIFAWTDKLVNYHSWITNDLGRFAQSYAAKFTADETDYEARLFHAATVLAQLGENEAVARYAAQFGYTLDYFGLAASVNGERDVSSWPGVNETVDEAFALALPAFETALADVSSIPQGWTGSIRLAADKYHLDEDVYLDLGDVMSVRAGLESAIALLHFAKGYDWTVDYESAEASRLETDANRRAYKLITEQTNFMARVRNLDSLAISKTWMATALQRALDAAAFMRARPAGGDMHFFEYDPELADEWVHATNLVSKALAALNGAQQVDVAEEVIGSYGSCNTALLPNDGLMHIYLGALFTGKITQDLRPAASLDDDGKLVLDFAAMKDPTIANLMPEFTSGAWSGIYGSATNGTRLFSKEAVPEVVDDEDVAIALKGSKDPALKRNIVDVVAYESYREWAQTVCTADGASMAGARAVKGSANAWLSYALGADCLIGKELESGDVKIESFSQAPTEGKFEFVVSIEGVNVGSGLVEESIFKENLKKVLGVEGAATLTPGAFSSDNVDIVFDTPVDGKAKFTVAPPADAGGTFFMRVKVK